MNVGIMLTNGSKRKSLARTYSVSYKDQYEPIGKHTEKGIDFCEKYCHFIKERCQIELEYAQKLKRLVKNYQPKKKEEDELQFSVVKGFLQSINELFDLAGQHEVIAENLQTSIYKECRALIEEIKIERKKCLNEGAKQQKQLQSSISQLENAKKIYEKAFKEAERAQEGYKRADADMNLARAEVEKSKHFAMAKSQQCEESKNEYASQLQKTNEHQHQHYGVLMPQIFQQLQDMDEKRITQQSDFIKRSAEVERSVIPIINTCLDGIVKASESINSQEDSRIVIERHKSGFQHPGDIAFDDLSNGNDNQVNANTVQRTPTDNRSTKGGTWAAGKGTKRGKLFGLFSSSKGDPNKEDFSNLPPNQQKKKLNQKIDNFKQLIAKDTAERDGMVKMRDVYVQNPALGDPSSLDKQLEENAQKLDSLKQEMQKYETYLATAEGKFTPPTAQRTNNRTGRNSLSSEDSSSITRSASDISCSTQGTPSIKHNNQIKEGGDASPVPATDRKSRADSFDDSFDDLDDADYLPVIGKAKALYSFEANSDGAISMMEGEDLDIVEQDQGDGWTRARKHDGSEGFIPTSYVQYC
ncbi:unnamed protein product [Owenia fusiformis]|uniref:Formin-binding protein 1-like n=1 Tax=Owenia fusiformis TaxID=6347 RepID=A0A8S4P106_OWEFU|nr:unnamed protein product [Owenia fusiformis]